jgi:hypothetical protein
VISIAALLSPMSQTTIRAWAVTKLVSYGIPANNWRQGGTYSTLLTVTAAIFAMFASTLTAALSAAFLGTASGPWLVALAFYVYGVTAQSATYGTATLTFTNTGGGIYNYEAGQVVVSNATPGNAGNTFVTTEALLLAAGTPSSPTTATIAIQAQATGSAGGAAAGTITTLVTSMAGVSVTNAAAVIGLDADTDPTIVQKCLAAIAARSYKGPTGAYYAAVYGYGNVPGATNVVSGLPVNVNRIQVYTDPDTGNITVFVASPSGIADPNDVAGVQLAINLIARPEGITATAASATVQNFTAAMTVWSTSIGPTNAGNIQASALSARDAAMVQYPIGGRAKPPSLQGYLYSSYLVAAVGAVDPTIYAVDLSSWSALALAPGQVASVTGGITVKQVSS